MAVWRRTPAGTAVLIGRVHQLMTSAQAVLDVLGVRVALEDASGHLSWGSKLGNPDQVTRTVRQTELPWTIHVALVDPVATQAVSTSRRNLFAAGFAVMLLAITTAGISCFGQFTASWASRGSKSDFVAAVSHEFRTPLTAMCHLAEMLEGGGTPPDRLLLYYQAIGRESRRLHAIVERLLDFGRIDAGRRGYQFVDTDATEFVNHVVADCRDHEPSSAHRIDWQAPSDQARDAVRIRADRDALAIALRNLLDNASKYSPESSMVRVSIEQRGAFVGIAVEDEGVGIPKDSSSDLSQVRPRLAARTLNVKGTGIGSTIAERIVKAHGGRLDLESKPGRGSRFTAFLPIQPSPA